MNIYLATGNSHKFSEFAEMICAVNSSINLFNPNMAGGMPEVDEDANDFIGNAVKKAGVLLPAVAEDAWVLADDSGLCVEVLDGRPGIKSARFAGENANDSKNNARLIEELEAKGVEESPAYFVCALALVNGQGEEITVEGRCSGIVRIEASGDAGFGYDPHFYPEGHKESFAQLGAEKKHLISHRKRAIDKLMSKLT